MSSNVDEHTKEYHAPIVISEGKLDKFESKNGVAKIPIIFNIENFSPDQLKSLSLMGGTTRMCRISIELRVDRGDGEAPDTDLEQISIFDNEDGDKPRVPSNNVDSSVELSPSDIEYYMKNYKPPTASDITGDPNDIDFDAMLNYLNITPDGLANEPVKREKQLTEAKVRLIEELDQDILNYTKCSERYQLIIRAEGIEILDEPREIDRDMAQTFNHVSYDKAAIIAVDQELARMKDKSCSSDDDPNKDEPEEEF